MQGTKRRSGESSPIQIESNFTSAGKVGSGIRGVKNDNNKPQPTGTAIGRTIRKVNCVALRVRFGCIIDREKDLSFDSVTGMFYYLRIQRNFKWIRINEKE